VPDILGNDQSIPPIVQAARLVVSHEGAFFRVGMPDRKPLQYVQVYQQGAGGIMIISYASLNILGKDWGKKGNRRGQTRIPDIETAKWDVKVCGKNDAEKAVRQQKKGKLGS
jgi:hypothetical protein